MSEEMPKPRNLKTMKKTLRIPMEITLNVGIERPNVQAELPLSDTKLDLNFVGIKEDLIAKDLVSPVVEVVLKEITATVKQRNSVKIVVGRVKQIPPEPPTITSSIEVVEIGSDIDKFLGLSTVHEIQQHPGQLDLIDVATPHDFSKALEGRVPPRPPVPPGFTDGETSISTEGSSDPFSGFSPGSFDPK